MAEAAVATVEEPRLGMMAWMGIGRDRFGKGFLSQLLEIARLARAPNRLAPYEYFSYHLFDDRRYTPGAKATFVGASFRHWIRNEVLVDAWYLIGDDKPVLTSLLRAHGLPVPETRAVYHHSREISAGRALRTTEELATFLRTEAAYPLFAKPATSSNSIGAYALAACEGDSLVLQDGRSISVHRFVEAQQAHALKGVVFEEQLSPHPDVAALVGEERLATVRVLVLQPPGGPPSIHRVGIRLPTGSHPTDNLWRAGNLLGGVDPETGVIGKVVQGEVGTYDRVHTHPDTGAAFSDTQLPDWEQVKSLALRAASILPMCPIQGWDFALTPDGPVILELEADGAEPGVLQLGQDVGILEGAYPVLLAALQQRRQDLRAEVGKQNRQQVAQAYQDVFSNRE